MRKMSISICDKATKNAKNILKEGDRIRVKRCADVYENHVVLGWFGNWIDTNIGYGDVAAIHIDRLNGKPIDFTAPNIKVKRDVLTPGDVLDRMCESVVHQDTVAFMDDVQLFWRKGWNLSHVPDPHEEDALKYALKACFLERMAEVWSEPPKSCPMQAPGWCQLVPAVKKEFSVIPEEYRGFYEGDLVSPIFNKRNIFAPRDFMFFA